MLRPRKQPEKAENWFKKNSTLIIAISNIVLVVVTILYVILTSEISDTAQMQMRLNTDPQISIYSENRPIMFIMKDTILEFSIKNHSNSDLSNVELQLKFYLHYMNTQGQEGFIDFCSTPISRPDLNIFLLQHKSIETFTIDFKPYLLNFPVDSGYFYLMDAIDVKGHWTKLQLRKDFGFEFAIFVFKYYRQEDGKKFTQQFYFRVEGLRYFRDKVLFIEANNLEEIIRTNQQFNLGIIERDDIFPRKLR